MKEPLPECMVYIRVDIPVSAAFRDALLQEDPQFECLGMTLSQLLIQEITGDKVFTDDSDGTTYPTRDGGSNLSH